jgi:hypothetical protein
MQDDFFEFVTSWTFMLLMAVCLLVTLLVGVVGIILIVMSASRRDSRRRGEGD